MRLPSWPFWQRSPLTSICLVCAVVANLSCAMAAEPEIPNIIVIYTDDQGFGDASCLNPESKFQTPNIDRLAREGIAFTDAHCADTVCTPSRYGLLTGRYCWRTKRKTGVMGAEGACLIVDGRMTLATLLRVHGYDTAMVGKWHLGMDFPGKDARSRDWSQPVRDMPLDKGFDYFYGVPASLNYGILAWFEGRYAKVPPTLFTAKKSNDRHVDYRIMPPYQDSAAETKAVVGTLGMEVASDFIDNQCLTRFTDKAIEWMQSRLKEEKEHKPFFLYLPYTSPHYPVCPLPEFHGQGEAGGYGEFMVETDHHVGRILKFLKDSKLDDNTMIVFTSDNGPESSWKLRAEEFAHQSNGPYREGKRSIYEGGHRVPFFVRWPKGIQQPGRVCDATICQTDLLATFSELIGESLPANAGEDSYSFLSVLASAEFSRDRPPVIHHAMSGQFAIRDGNWKLVMAHGKQPTELFDLSLDIAEQNNVAADHPEIVERLTHAATQIVVSGRSTSGPAQPNDTRYWSDLTWIDPAEYMVSP